MNILNIKLGVEGVNLVLAALAGRPYGEVHELIAVIRKQAEDQLAAAQQDVATEEAA